MKARIPNNFIQKQVEEIVSQKYDQIYRDVSERTKDTVIKQSLALALYVLETEYGWKEKRLKRFFYAFNCATYTLSKGDALRKPIRSLLDVVDYIDGKYHIGISDVSEVQLDKDGYPIDTDKQRKARQHKERIERQKQRR